MSLLSFPPFRAHLVLGALWFATLCPEADEGQLCIGDSDAGLWLDLGGEG